MDKPALKDAPHLYTTFEIAKLLGVDMGSVIDWCQQGKLAAFKTPGGHRRINAQDLTEFLIRYNMPVPPTLLQTGRLTCLIVDDEPEIRRLAGRIIRSIDENANVLEAQDGFEAGAKAIESVPGLVLLDINLPGINGIQVCERLRGDARFKHTKILAITGQDTPETKAKMLEAGADDYLPKPFPASELKERIQRLLNK